MRVINFKSCTMPEITGDEVKQIVEGVILVTWNGSPLFTRLSAAEREAYEESKINHFIVVTNSRRDQNMRAAFYHWCRAVGEPFVVVERRRRHSSVTLDMITVTDARPYKRILTEDIQKELRGVVWGLSERGALIGFGGELVSSSRVLNERAESLAGILYAAATAPRKWGEIEAMELPLISRAIN